MAGEWIKMRSELWTHPKFLALCARICDHNENMANYVIRNRNETVTDPPLRTITESALRDVTMCCLLRVWLSVSAHCKVLETDAIMHPMALLDIDIVAGLEGFGMCMLKVGWVTEDEDQNTLIFKNFCEFNEPACLRKTPKTAAERQKEWRERQKTKNGTVTNRNETVTQSNARREENKKEHNTTPLPPLRQFSSEEVERFDRLWAEYPKKEHRIEALAVFVDLNPDESTISAMISSVGRRKRSHTWQKNNGQYIPLLENWLAKRRWLDDTQGSDSRKEAIERQRAANAQERASALPLEQVSAMLKGIGKSV